MFRRFGAVLLLCSAIVVIGCSSGPAQERDNPAPDNPAPAATAKAAKQAGRPGVDWPRFLGPDQDSKSPETGILTKWPAGGPRIVWQKDIGVSYGIGTIKDGRFYQFDRYGDKARLTCLDAKTGEEKWRFEYATDYADLYGYNGGPRTSPVIDDGRVFIYGAEGKLHALDAKTGEKLWAEDVNRRFGVVQNFFGVGSTPVVDGDLLLVMVGGSPPESRNLPPGALDQATNDGTAIVAFDKKTGEIKYQTGNDLASYSSLKTAAIGDRRWCFAFCRGGLLGFEPQTGKIDFHYKWRSPKLESVNASTPVVVGDEVFISETYGPGSSLLKVSPGDYEVVWADDPQEGPVMQTHWNTVVYHNGYLYGSSGRHEGNAELRCIDWKTGDIKWSKQDLGRCSLLYVDGHFVCLAERGELSLLRATPEKYDLVASATLKDDTAVENGFAFGPTPLLRYPCWAAPILSHGLLYVRGEGKLVCLELIPPTDE